MEKTSNIRDNLGEEFMDLIACMGEVFWIRDLKLGKTIYVSQSYHDLFETDPQQLINNPNSWSDKIHRDDKERVVTAFKENALNNQFSEEYRIVLNDGSIRWIHSKAYCKNEADGSISKMIGLSEDITDRKKVQIELKKANEHVYSSLMYASRIQNAILPSQDVLSNWFKEIEIIFKPKDIVSGDFYWFEKDPKNEHAAFFGVFDCTGHGVPGAFMSFIGNHFLSYGVNDKGVVDPGKLLDILNKGVVSTLNKSNNDVPVYDGMDCVLSYYDKKNKIFKVSGARNSIYHLRGNQLDIFSSARKSIGYESIDHKFESLTISIEKSDRIFLLSDGFLDQFGGFEGKKIQQNRFNELLILTSELSLNEQRKAIEEFLDEWQSDSFQVDDICILGVEI